MKKKEETIEFKNRGDFRKWLEMNSNQEESIWIRLNKLDKSGLKAGEALEEALCFGWIDSIVKRQDDVHYLKKFSKRRSKSNWSEYNKKLVGRLIKEGKMTEPGLHAVELAKKNGMWDRKDEFAVIPEEMIHQLRHILVSNGLSPGKFDKVPPSAKKGYTAYYFMAKKEETRVNRMRRIIDSIENGPYLF